MSLKAELTCTICKLVLSSTPISLPCLHALCSEHLQDGTVKDSSIRCLECEREFDVPDNGFPINKMASILLAKDLHLSDEEKRLKHAVETLIQQLERVQSDFKQKLSDLEGFSIDHYSEVRRQIDVQREEFKKKIDEIALKMIEQVKEKEKFYISAIKQSSLAVTPVNIAESRRIMENEFRNPNLVIEEVQRLQNEHEQKINEFRTRLVQLNPLGIEINSLKFKPSKEASFGMLTAYQTNELIACAEYKTIKISNLDSDECLATLEGHSTNIYCLTSIDENRFASGSGDKTIIIWDAKNFVCLKTLTGHPNGVDSLTSLTSNRLASGSSRDIKIWDIESGECLQTINGHSDWIRGLVCLPNGNLVSCSDDRTIKVWDLASGECINTLTYHSNAVKGIVLLRNGRLASGSEDTTIRIWDTSSGECIKTLKGHSKSVYRLQELESGELASCSFDCTIRIWNLESGTCIRTLVGHRYSVTSIRVNSKNNTLMSCSLDGTIKSWDLKTGVCVKTIVVQEDAYLRDLILI